jgi:hypothetical protein
MRTATDGGVLHGDGTTLTRVTRTSEREYVVEAAADSLAWLWDVRRIGARVDLGLRAVAFCIRLTVTPTTP